MSTVLLIPRRIVAVVAGASTAALMTMTCNVAADPQVENPPTKAGQAVVSGPRNWYGWQTLALDGASLGGLGIGAELFAAQGSHETLAPQVLLWSGFAGSTVGAPIVHWVHGNVGKGFGSLGLRVAGWLLVAVGNPEGGRGNPGVAALGVAVFGSAVVLDAAVFGYSDRSDANLASRQWVSPAFGKSRGLTLGSTF